MRYGTRTRTRRKWTPRAHRPACPVHIGYEWGYLYAAICPYLGELFCLLLPRMTKVCFTIFMQHFETHLASMGIDRAILFLDQAANHQWAESSNVRLHHLPAACPELNPVERFFEEVRREMDGKVYLTLDALESDLLQVLNRFSTDHLRLAKLTMFSYISTSW